MGIFDVLNGGETNIPEDVKRLSDKELIYIFKENPYGWSIIKMAAVSQELKNRGIVVIR